MRKGLAVLVAVFALMAASCTGHITGGGFVLDAAEAGKANFGFNLNCDSLEDRKGHVTYHDKSEGLKASGTVTACLPDGAVGTWTPQGKSTFVGGTFVVTVVDNGEPGTADTFSITLYDGAVFLSTVVYENEGILLGGNIQNHDA